MTASLVADPLPPRPRLAPPTCKRPNGAHEHVNTATAMFREMDMGVLAGEGGSGNQ